MNINASELRSFYTGLILSDGTIDIGRYRRSFRLKTIQQDFAEYIVDFTSNHTQFNVRADAYPARVDKNNVNHREYWQVVINSTKYFAKLYHHFYDDYRVKHMYSDVLKWLDLRGWANFYMSDGYVCHVGKTHGELRDCRVDLCTDCFTKAQNEMCAQLLQDSYGYKTSIIQRKQNGKLTYRVRIAKSSAQQFFLDIDKYVVNSMKYKLLMPYTQCPSWMIEDYYAFMKRTVSAGHLNWLPDNWNGDDIVHRCSR